MPVRSVHQQVASYNMAKASRASSATTAGYLPRKIECSPALLVEFAHQ